MCPLLARLAGVTLHLLPRVNRISTRRGVCVGIGHPLWRFWSFPWPCWICQCGGRCLQRPGHSNTASRRVQKYHGTWSHGRATGRAPRARSSRTRADTPGFYRMGSSTTITSSNGRDEQQVIEGRSTHATICPKLQTSWIGRPANITIYHPAES